MAIQLKATRSKKPRVYMHLVPVDELMKLATNMGRGVGKQRQKARNELTKRRLTW